MHYCERHKSFYPVCCQACQWEVILGLDKPKNPEDARKRDGEARERLQKVQIQIKGFDQP